MDEKQYLAAATAALFAGLKIDQIAFACHSDEQELEIKQMLGLQDKEWVEDEVIAFGKVGGEPFKNCVNRNRAKLLFNYDLGIEVEILRYLGGPNYVDLLGFRRGVCHIGMHTEKGTPLQRDDVVANLFPAPIIQQVRTQSHTNEFLLESGRRYRYTIFDTSPILGTCLKVIERIEPEAK